MTSLLDPLTEDQQELVEIVAQVFLKHGRWPIFDYVEKTLDRDRIDANHAIATFPSSERLYGGGPYSAVWTTGGGNDRTVELTVLGMVHSKSLRRDPRYPPPEGAFFMVLGYLVNLYGTADPPTPFEISNVEANGEDLSALLKSNRYDGWFSLDSLFDLLKHEPATWYGSGSSYPDGSKKWLITRHVMNYADVTDVPSYLERMEALAPPPPAPPRAVPSPLNLPAALDYLDAIWRLVPAHKESLLSLHSAERTAKLGEPAQTADELHGRLSALAEVVSGFRVPKPAASPKDARTRDSGDSTLRNLRAHLRTALPTQSHARIDEAIDRLQDIIELRHGGHHGHSDTRSKAAAAYARRGISYPPTDWGFAWTAVQSRAVEALEEIREELALLTR